MIPFSGGGQEIRSVCGSRIILRRGICSDSSTAAPRRHRLHSLRTVRRDRSRIASPFRLSPKSRGFSGSPDSPRFFAHRARSAVDSRRAERGARLETFITAAIEKGVTLLRNTFFWRRTRDSNSRAALATYSLSRGASSPLE